MPYNHDNDHNAYLNYNSNQVNIMYDFFYGNKGLSSLEMR